MEILSAQRHVVIQVIRCLSAAHITLARDLEAALLEQPEPTEPVRLQLEHHTLRTQAQQSRVEAALVEADLELAALDETLESSEPVTAGAVQAASDALDAFLSRTVALLHPRLELMDWMALDRTRTMLNLASIQRVELYVSLDSQAVERLLGDLETTWAPEPIYVRNLRFQRLKLSHFPEAARLTYIARTPALTWLLGGLTDDVRAAYSGSWELITLEKASQSLHDRLASNPALCKQLLELLENILASDGLFQSFGGLHEASTLVRLVYMLKRIELEQAPPAAARPELPELLAYVRAVVIDLVHAAQAAHEDLAAELAQLEGGSKKEAKAKSPAPRRGRPLQGGAQSASALQAAARDALEQARRDLASRLTRLDALNTDQVETEQHITDFEVRAADAELVTSEAAAHLRGLAAIFYASKRNCIERELVAFEAAVVQLETALEHNADVRTRGPTALADLQSALSSVPLPTTQFKQFGMDWTDFESNVQADSFWKELWYRCEEDTSFKSALVHRPLEERDDVQFVLEWVARQHASHAHAHGHGHAPLRAGSRKTRSRKPCKP